MNNLPIDYQKTLLELKERINKARYKSFVAANSEVILMYLDIEKVVSEKVKSGWGKSVIIDLKIGDVLHQDLVQMQMYINYYDRFVKTEDENPTIGIILYKEKNNTLVEITLPKDNNQIFASKYQTFLPSKEELKDLLEKEI